ncbi:GGDEF domain-containing protein [Amphritea opalescens]|uniref:diguanylate cyclase n=1 Tax=Amphritea opalescens TaxID=2490544 RepID=A0A430KSA7_9GAMM|nr:GGDEF domain-containing protein [Amphritea opalescens]RTE66377.1 GGDEF domain-containing protein [Amphritea opalescens]
MIDTRQTETNDRLQTIVILVVSVIVFAVLYVGGQAYEERVAVQHVHLAMAHEVDGVDPVAVSKATDLDQLWSVYGPQASFTESEFRQLADPIMASHQSYLPLFIALVVAGLTFATLGMMLKMRACTRRFDSLLAAKEASLQQSQDKLASVTVLDELTGLINSRHFNRVLSTECRRAVREFSPLTLMIIAVDKPDDESAEAITDQQLCQVAGVLKGAISRPGDRVARIAAKQFALLLPSTNEQSPMLAQRLCEDISQIEPAHRLRVSIGTSTLQPSAQLTAESIMAKTELALAEAIQCGDGQVKAHTEGAKEMPVTFDH